MSISKESKESVFYRDVLIIGRQYLLNLIDTKILYLCVTLNVDTGQIVSIDFNNALLVSEIKRYPLAAPLVKGALENFYRRFRIEFLEVNHATDLASFYAAADSYFKEIANVDGDIVL